MLEKVVSLVRFSFDEDPVKSISGKIRHFYDLFYLLSDQDCKKYIDSKDFKEDFVKLIEHDKSFLMILQVGAKKISINPF